MRLVTVVGSASLGAAVGRLLTLALILMPRWVASIRKKTPPPRAHRYVAPLLNALLFGYLSARWGWSWRFVGCALVGSCLLLLALIDGWYHVVPNLIVYPALVLSLGGQLALHGTTGALNALLAGGLAFGFFLAVALLSRGGMGGGDVKLVALIGVLVGFPEVLWALSSGILVGGIAAIVLLATTDREDERQMPYAPFLCLGALVALLWDPLPWLLETLL